MIGLGDRNNNRQEEINELIAKGLIPHDVEAEKNPENARKSRIFFLGRVAALINDVLPAQTIVDNMVNDAARIITENAAKVVVKPKL